VLSLLSLEASRMKGFAYLVLYNLIFVVPLLMILSASAARPSLHTLNRWQMAHRESVRMLLGSGVVVMGLLILATL
jgi:cytochrome c-type biogenesis protein